MSQRATESVVLTGVGTHCHVASWRDPISVKTVCYGQVEWRFGKRCYRIQPDTLLLVPEGDEYALTIDSSEPTRGFNVLFRRGLVEECWRSAVAEHEELLDAPYDIGPLPFPRRMESRFGSLGRAVDALAAGIVAKAEPDVVSWLFEALAASAAEALCEQRREHQRVRTVRRPTRLEIQRRLVLAREAIEDNLASSWTLSKMGRAAMMAPHHFHRCFRATFRETPRAWLSRRRAERAMALLRTTRSSILEICLAVGYTSASSFSTSFAARYGASPSRVARPHQTPGWTFL